MDPVAKMGLDTSSPLRSLPQDQNFFKGVLLPSLVILAVILLGSATGWFLSQKNGPKDEVAKAPAVVETEAGKEVGTNQANFKDTAEGILKEGGIEGEGTHHLEREGGTSQNVYLTSSVVDLDQFVDQKVQVFGETFDGKKAGWLMDVGKVKVLE